MTKHASKFDHCKGTNVELYLNGKYYPYDNLNLEIEKGRFALLYDIYASFRTLYYTTGTLLSPAQFKSSAFLFCNWLQQIGRIDQIFSGRRSVKTWIKLTFPATNHCFLYDTIWLTGEEGACDKYGAQTLRFSPHHHSFLKLYKNKSVTLFQKLYTAECFYMENTI